MIDAFKRCRNNCSSSMRVPFRALAYSEHAAVNVFKLHTFRGPEVGARRFLRLKSWTLTVLRIVFSNSPRKPKTRKGLKLNGYPTAAAKFANDSMNIKNKMK